jgi:hypothetical protein
MLNAAEFIFSAFLVFGIVMFGVGYGFGYWRWCNKTRPIPESRRYLYNKSGDTL